MELRHQFTLLAEDETFLNTYGHPWETIVEKGQWVLIHGISTHSDYTVTNASVAIFLTPGYPQAQLDMVYVYPPLARKDGRAIPQTEATTTLDGKSWQRWSRHRTSEHPWRVGEDSIETHVYLIEEWFTREFEK